MRIGTWVAVAVGGLGMTTAHADGLTALQMQQLLATAPGSSVALTPSQGAQIAGAVQQQGGAIGATLFNATGMTASRTPSDRAADTVSVRDMGARGDTVVLRQNVYTRAAANPNTVIFSNGGMVPSMVGKVVVVAGAGAPGPGSHLVTTLASVTDAQDAVLAAAAAATGSFTGQIMVGYHALTATFSFTAGSTRLAASGAVFNQAMAGADIILPGAGIAPLVSAIVAVPDGNSLTLATAPATRITDIGQDVPIGTDDTAAIQAAYALATTRTTPAVLIPDGRYLVTSTLNLSGYSGGRTSGTGTIYGAVSDMPVVDLLSARFTRWSGVDIAGDPSTLPVAGLAIGRISAASADNHRFQDFSVTGAFGLAALEDVGAESTAFVTVQFANTVGPFVAVLDGIRHFTDASPDVSQIQAPEVPNSFNEAVFVTCLFSGSSRSGAPVWMASTGKTRFDASSYLATASPQAVILYGGAQGGNISLPVFDLHMEPTTLSYDYVMDGPTSPTITNMEWRDHNIQARVAAFHIDANAGFASQTLNDVDFVLGVNGGVTPGLVDAPASWRISGMVHAPAGLWNMPASAFSGCYWPIYGAPTCDNMSFDGTATTVNTPLVARGGVQLAGTAAVQLGDKSVGGWSTLAGDGTGRLVPARFAADGTYQAGSLDLVGGITATGASRLQGGVVSTQSSTYTVTASDCGSLIRDIGNAPHTYTVPAGLTVGCQIDVEQAGNGGTITITAGSGETLEQAGSGVLLHATTGQFARAVVKIDGASTFLLGGQVQ